MQAQVLIIMRNLLSRSAVLRYDECENCVVTLVSILCFCVNQILVKHFPKTELKGVVIWIILESCGI